MSFHQIIDWSGNLNLLRNSLRSHLECWFCFSKKSSEYHECSICILSIDIWEWKLYILWISSSLTNLTIHKYSETISNRIPQYKTLMKSGFILDDK